MKKDYDKIPGIVEEDITSSYKDEYNKPKNQSEFEDIEGEVLDEETIEALKEAEQIANDPTVKGYRDVHQMLIDILDEDDEE